MAGEIIKKLRETEGQLAEGRSTEAASRAIEVSPATYHRWKSEYGGMNKDALKRAVADLARGKAILKEIAEEQC